MKKKTLVIICVLLVVLLAGCDQIPFLKQFKDAYLSTRVVQLLTQMPTTTVKPVEGTPTEVQPKEIATNTPAPTVEPTTVQTTAVPPTSIAPTFTSISTLAATLTPMPTFTPTSTGVSTDPAVYLGKAIWKDPFDENKGWAVDTDKFTNVTIANGAMRLVSLTSTDGWRLAPTDSLGNNYIEATITTETCSANDHYGLMFRVPVLAEADRGYLFGITCDGRYNLRKFDGKVGEKGLMLTLVPYTFDGNIKAGSNKTNRLGIMTIDDRLVMFINGVKVSEFKDTTYPQGFFGLFIGAKNTKNFAVAVGEMSYWSNPKLP
jgi:hypothetical protein